MSTMSFSQNIIVKTIVHRIKETVMRFRYYKLSFCRKNRQQFYIAVFDEKRTGFGLADRLNGIISLYAFCKIKNIPFRCTFTYPFDLSLYLEPSLYDWKLKNGEKSQFTSDVRILIVQGEGNGNRLLGLKTKKQVHAYLNRNYLPVYQKKLNASLDWRELFHELFKPTEKLNAQINDHLNRINSNYIACQFRFLSFLGDFKEYNLLPLSSGEQQDLIKTCTEALCSLRKKHDLPILVTSDSSTFLSHVSGLENIFTIPGKVIHIDCTHDAAEEVCMKPFVDFMMLSKASKIYNVVAGPMYPSSFPLYAAKINNVPFERIVI